MNSEQGNIQKFFENTLTGIFFFIKQSGFHWLATFWLSRFVSNNSNVFQFVKFKFRIDFI